MIFSADATWRRAMSISACAVSGSGGTLRILSSATSHWTSASVIEALDQWDEGLFLDRPDESCRVRLPVLCREHGRIDFESEFFARLAAEPCELVPVRLPE